MGSHGLISTESFNVDGYDYANWQLLLAPQSVKERVAGSHRLARLRRLVSTDRSELASPGPVISALIIGGNGEETDRGHK